MVRKILPFGSQALSSSSQELGPNKIKYQVFLNSITNYHALLNYIYLILHYLSKLSLGLDGDLEYSTDEDGWQDPDMPGPSNQPNNPFNITIADPNAAPTGIDYELCLAKDN